MRSIKLTCLYKDGDSARYPEKLANLVKLGRRVSTLTHEPCAAQCSEHDVSAAKKPVKGLGLVKSDSGISEC